MSGDGSATGQTAPTAPFGPARGGPELAAATFAQLSRNIPIGYFITGANALVVSGVFWNAAPFWLVRFPPFLACLLCLWRIGTWWMLARRQGWTERQIRRRLTSINILAPAYCLMLCLWCAALFHYGSLAQQSFLVFSIAISVIGCIVCLTSSLPVAMSTIVLVSVSLLVFLGLHREPTLRAMALVLALALVGFVASIRNYNRNFAEVVAATTRSQALSEENFSLANVDDLTDLPNRRHFFTRLEQEFAAASRRGAKLALGVIDLNGFKLVNDLYGHPVGDALLIKAAQRLKTFDADGRLGFSRLGGDEFAFLMLDDATADSVLQRAERICEYLGAPYTLGNIVANISCSIGLALYPDAAADSRELFSRADYALYAGKKTRRGQPTLFSPDHEEEVLRNSRIEQCLLAADIAAEFSLKFQPIIEVTTGHVVAFESLMRWESPVLGAISPAVFIPIAERTGIIGKLTCALLEKALATATRWPGEIRLSFNLSALDICTPGTVISLIMIAMKSDFDPKRIDFEITETAVIQDFEKARSGLNALRALGCGISLDDFGTGFSSLSQLHLLPLTKIKVDSSFVTELHENSASYKIVKSLVALSRDMGIGCIVEGVETGAEVAALRSLDCVHMQGYHFFEPLAEGDALECAHASLALADGEGWQAPEPMLRRA